VEAKEEIDVPFLGSEEKRQKGGIHRKKGGTHKATSSTILHLQGKPRIGDLVSLRERKKMEREGETVEKKKGKDRHLSGRESSKGSP